MIAAFLRRHAGHARAAQPAPARVGIDLSDLTRSARKAVLAERRERRTAALRAATPSPIEPLSTIVADIRARRATKGE